MSQVERRVAYPVCPDCFKKVDNQGFRIHPGNQPIWKNRDSVFTCSRCGFVAIYEIKKQILEKIDWNRRNDISLESVQCSECGEAPDDQHWCGCDYERQRQSDIQAEFDYWERP